MRHTNQQTTTKTLADLYRSIDRQHVVTVSFLKEEKDDTGKKTGRLVETVRSLELYEISTTSKGYIVFEAMDRATGESRTVRVDRVISYTVHRMAYVLDRPAPTTYTHPTPAPPDSVEALFFYELARDQDDADYTPRTLIQADTSLAA
ncbi:hypothetical protein OG369_42600 [Streptomyces sp. NBC_01221]|uniref:hypothetical protein n=1 Tax=Streptomyces sp. NBC_01221 TaxID=2903782 RepID=UPI0022527252|nr:hypothetical protein [Streptomyces sp. NBC_01221]MCX4792468.1 hypothetical protein [Streptomyces sp. NBC_01221]